MTTFTLSPCLRSEVRRKRPSQVLKAIQAFYQAELLHDRCNLTSELIVLNDSSLEVVSDSRAVCCLDTLFFKKRAHFTICLIAAAAAALSHHFPQHHHHHHHHRHDHHQWPHLHRRLKPKFAAVDPYISLSKRNGTIIRI